MKVLTRDFTAREKILLLIFGIMMVLLLYYLGVQSPVGSGIKAANIEIEALQTQVDAVNKKKAALSDMKKEMDVLEDDSSSISQMPSYNASKEEVDFLHSTLAATTDYYVGFTQVTREGDLIRREFSLQYKSNDFNSAIEVMKSLENSEIRCMISDMSVTPVDDTEGANILSQPVQVSATATFYETMHGGVEDKELPEDSKAEE